MKKLKFEELNLSPEVQRAVADMGFEEASPIQSEAIPYLLEGRDVIGQAQTGTGKTAAFGIPTIEKIDPADRRVQALILCPTRELAIQVAEEIQKLIKYKKGISVVPIYGGQSYDRQFRALKMGVQIVIGTPGRVMDHIERGTLNLDAVKMMVLDEADEMLDMGFREDIEFVLTKIPEERQTVFFSATMSKPIMDLTKRYQNNPQLVKMLHQTLTVENVEQIYYEVRNNMKIETLSRILDMYNLKLVLVFCNTKRMVDEAVSQLQARGYFADGMHGDMNQNQRNSTLQKFRNGTLEILVATDVAARGIDVENVEAVINYDMPQDEESYVHRIGRTGRAGRSGRAFSFVAGRTDFFKLKDIQRYTKAKINQENVPSFEDVAEVRTNLFLDQVREVLQKGGLTKHIHKVERLLDEDFTSIEVAAALLKIGMKEQKIKEKGMEASKAMDGPREGMVRLFVTQGKKDQLHPKDLVDALSAHTGMPPGKIGDIDLYDKFSFVEVPREYADKVVDRMGRTQINGMSVTFQVAQKKGTMEGESTPSSRFGDSDNSFDRPKGKRKSEGFRGRSSEGFKGKSFGGRRKF
jgi:ATP-dependent RNA helicase DeaD